MWIARERLAAFAVFDPPRRVTAGFDVQIHPEARGQGIEQQVVDWVVERACAAPHCERLVADPGIYEEDTALIRALEQRGFHATGGSGILCRSLEMPLPYSSIPAGFSIRPIGPEEIAARAQAHREVFAPSRVTDREYTRLVRMPGYEAQLDLAAVTPKGEISAFALGWIDSENRVGEFEPVGTRPDFRRGGLAGALMVEGMRRMKARGAASVFVGPIDRDEAGACAFYESLGMARACSLLSFARETSARN
jgi:ribosomal protein S18 acetylase RimI-like enzyme